MVLEGIEMKTMVVVLALTAVLFTTTGRGNAAESAARNKILVAYFSWSGNTRGIAGKIHEQAGGDIFEIEPVKPCSSNYNTVLDEAQRDQRALARPELKTHVENIGQYDVVFLGYPNWLASIPMPIASFLEEYDFSGKIIVPFCSHGGGRLGQSVSAIAKLCPKSTILEALSVHHNGGASLKSDISKWLDKVGIAKQG
jgi:flavodoxin